MKIPKAKRLPSGSWNIGLMVEGRRMSITAPTEKECVAKAAAVKAGLEEAKDRERSGAITVGEAIDRYIESKDAVLSPATVRGYRRIRKDDLQELMGLRLRDLRQEQVQRAVNAMARKKSPKSVRNAHGLLSAMLAVYRPELVLRTTMPQKAPKEIRIPDMEELEAIFRASEGTPLEVPVLLAAWMGLRASEIRGLKWTDIQGDRIHIQRAVVDGPDGPAEKGTKTVSGTRWVRLPEHIRAVLEAQPRRSDYIVTLTGTAIYKRFMRLCQENGLPHYRFHDLRHTAASVAMAAGVPNTYNQRRMGHKTDHMLKTVYLHTTRDKEDAFADRIDRVYDRLFEEG